MNDFEISAEIFPCCVCKIKKYNNSEHIFIVRRNRIKRASFESARRRCCRVKNAAPSIVSPFPVVDTNCHFSIFPAALGSVRNSNMPSYQKTNKAGCSGDEFRYTALFFAFAVVVLTIIAVSLRVEPYKIDDCTSREDKGNSS